MHDIARTTDLVNNRAQSGGFYRQRLLRTLDSLLDCQLRLVEGGTEQVLGRPAAEGDSLSATLVVHDASLYRAMALNGSIGAAESYMDGAWDCSDLTSLVRIFVRNRQLLDRMETGPARLGGALLRALHWLRRNSRAGSRRNIAAHYDLGNEFFELFLDRELMYSSAIFCDPHESLELASRRKLERICNKLALGPNDHLLEIGSGWGGMAIHAARHHGCRVTTTTISKEQHELAIERVARAGVSDRVTVLLEDYRDLSGRFDKLVSIEMIEAIGHQYLERFFAQCSALLKSSGLAVVQAITIEDHRYQRALRNVDFIQRHIFPGSFIPSIAAMSGAMAKASDLKLFHLEDIGPSYAATLNHWRQRFDANLERVLALGYPQRFVRMWHYYLAYCEGGFIERSIGNVQMLLCKPGARPRQFLPDLEVAI